MASPGTQAPPSTGGPPAPDLGLPKPDQSGGEKSPEEEKAAAATAKPKEPAPPEKVKIGEQEFTPDELTQLIAANAEHEGQKEFTALGLRVAQDLQRGREGLAALRGEISAIEKAQGYVEEKETAPEPLDLQIDMQEASETEKKLAKGLTVVHGGLTAASKQMRDMQNAILDRIGSVQKGVESIEVAQTAVAQVEQDTGLKLDPAAIRSAMRDTGIPDPSGAVFTKHKAKAREAILARATAKPKPEFIEEQSERTVDLSKMSSGEVMQAVRENPTLLENWTPRHVSMGEGIMGVPGSKAG